MTVEVTQSDKKLAKNVDQFTDQEIAVLQNTVAKGTTKTELAYFLMTAQSVGLNPFIKEIWAYKDNKGNLITIAGRDGFLKKAQQDKRWNGLVSAEVRQNDAFEADVPNGYISHKPNMMKERGPIVFAYAMSKPKGAEIATIEFAYLSVYKKGNNIWNKYPAAMIKKVAETNCLKKAYGISGLQSAYDFSYEEGSNVAQPIDTESPEPADSLEKKKDKINELLDQTDREDKEAIRQTCREKQQNGEFTHEFADNIIKDLEYNRKTANQ